MSLLRFLLLSLFCFSVHVHAAPRWQSLYDPAFQWWGTDKGLPHTIVTAIGEDAQGLLWVGTQGGLARWDGYRFRNYQPEAGRAGALPDNFIQVLHTDRTGRLWIGTSGGGLARYRPESDDFLSLPVAGKDGAKSGAGSSHVAINALADAEQGLWVGTNAGLDWLDTTRGQWQHYPAHHADNPVYALLAEGKDRLLVGSAKGLLRAFRDAQGGLQWQMLPLPGLAGQQVAVHSLHRANDGKIWIGTARHGIFILQQGRLSSLSQLLPAAAALRNEYAFCMSEPRPGLMWVGSYGHGIVQIDLENGQVRYLQHQPGLKFSLQDNTIRALWRSRQGLVWVGNQQGLQMHDAVQKGMLPLFGGQQRGQGLSDPDVFSVLARADGKIWLGLGNKGIDILDPASGQVQGIRPQAGGLPAQRVLSMQADANQVWVGTGVGLYQVRGDAGGDAKGNINSNQYTVRKMAGSSGDIRSLLLQGDRLWYGGFQDGLWWRPRNAAPEAVSHRAPGSAQLSDQRVSVLAAAADGKIWVGTRNGLNLYDTQQGTVEVISARPGTNRGLGASLVLSVLTDSRQRVWVGTLGGGISVLEGREANGEWRVRQLSTAHGLPHLNVAKIMEDNQGRILISTDNGLAQVDPATWTVRPLHMAEGMPIPAFWSDSGAATAHGEMLFGGNGGLVVTRPAQLFDLPQRAALVITDVRVMGKSVPALAFNQESGPGTEPGTPPALVLQAGQQHFSVEFARLDYRAAERLRYQYRLEGYDRDWLDADLSRRLATYTNLAPGSYQLQLRSSDRNGAWRSDGRSLTVHILPGWHQSWWFYTLLSAAGALLLWLLIFFATRLVRARQRELQQLVAQRTVQLEGKQQELLSVIGALNQANTELAHSADTLRQLGDMGRDITANLQDEKAFDALHRHICQLLDVHVLLIYRCDSDSRCLVRCFGKQQQQDLPSLSIAYEALQSHAAQVVHQQQEILLEREHGGQSGILTSLFAPLMTDGQVLGVLVLQSQCAHAYGERERMIIRTLCSYGAIALANASALAALHAAQAQLVQQEKMAALGSLVSGVAHEINTPLGVSILALSSARECWLALPKTMAIATIRTDGLDCTDLALHNAQRAARLIDNFRAITAHFDSDTAEQLDLCPYLQEITVFWQTEFMQRGLEWEARCEPGLQLHTIAAALTEVLNRMVRNVLDHAYPSGSTGRTILSARSAGNEIVISLQDQGCGIHAEHVQRVFEPFFTTCGAQHSGLGLHVAYNHTLQRLHGKIELESGPGGTCISLHLPLRLDLD